jgi:WD40 repeat protein
LPVCHGVRSFCGHSAASTGEAGHEREPLMAGRPESPLDPSEGPVARFAAELRKLRTEAGSPAYRVMAQRTGQGASTLSQAAAGDRLPTLPVVLAYVTACGGDAGEWEGRWRQAAKEAAASRHRDDDEDAPYRGLARFEPGDRDLFFGREALIAQLTGLMRTHRLVAVVGASGSGKSSLLRAGLIPALQTAEAPDRRPAAIRILTPGPHPLATHDGVMAPREEAEGDTVVVVDQFEELYTLCQDPAERAAFIGLLVAAVRPGSRLRVVIAVRADFFGRCAEHHQLAEALRQATLLVGPMSPPELREAIIKPAAASGLIVERELTAKIIDEVADEPGGLPLMSHALQETWRRRKGRALTVEMYQATGGIHGAIAKSAEDVYATLSPTEAQAARRTMLRLITPGDGAPDTRRPTDHAELDIDSPEAGNVLTQFVRARLLTVDGHTVDLAHEALMTAWPRYRTWIEESRDRLRLHRQLTEAAYSWDSLHRDPGALYRGTRLTSAQDVFGTDGHGDLTRLEHDFLAASFAARDQDARAAARTSRRLRTLTLTLSTLLAVALLASLIAWNQSRNSDHQRRLADAARQIALSRQLAAQSTRLMATDPDLASLLAVQAYRTSPTGEATSSLYSAAAFPLERRWNAHSAWVDAMAYSPDGHTLATASDDHTVRLWDAATGRARTTLIGHNNKVTSVAFSRDGHILASTGADRTVHLWDTSTGRSLRHWSVPDTGIEDDAHHGPTTRSVAFSPDGHTLATGSADHTARLWDTSTGRLRRTFHIPDPLWSMVFSPDGRTIAATNQIGGKGVTLYDMAGVQPHDLLSHATNTTAVTFSPDGKTVATGEDNTVRLWDAKTGHALTTLTGPTDVIRSVAFSPDGHTLAAASDDHTVRLWDTSTGQPLNALPEHTDQAVAVTFSPDGNTLATGSQDGTVRLWNVGTREPRTTLHHISFVRSLAFSPDGNTLATGSQDGAVRLWNSRTGGLSTTMGHITVPKRLPYSNPDAVALLTFGVDHRTLTTASDNDTVRRWNTATSQFRTVITGNSKNNDRPAALSTSEHALATLHISPHDSNYTVWLWDLTTGKHRATLPGAYASVSVVFSPDGRTLATAGDNRNVQLWNASTGRLQATLTAPGRALAFSPDGQTLAASSIGNTVQLWDVATHRSLVTLSGHQDTVDAVAFSPDGHTLATGSADRTVRLWDVGTGQLETSLNVAPTGAHTVAFSPDGHTLTAITHSLDHSGDTLRLWTVTRLTQAEAISKICQAVHRDLTAQERSTYLPGAPPSRLRVCGGRPAARRG